MKNQKTIAICLTDDQIAYVDEMAGCHYMSRSAYIRNMIRDEMDLYNRSDEIYEVFPHTEEV